MEKLCWQLVTLRWCAILWYTSSSYWQGFKRVWFDISHIAFILNLRFWAMPKLSQRQVEVEYLELSWITKFHFWTTAQIGKIKEALYRSLNAIRKWNTRVGSSISIGHPPASCNFFYLVIMRIFVYAGTVFAWILNLHFLVNLLCIPKPLGYWSFLYFTFRQFAPILIRCIVTTVAWFLNVVHTELYILSIGFIVSFWRITKSAGFVSFSMYCLECFQIILFLS